MPMKYVRVRDEHGNRFTVQAQEVAANPDAYEVLDEPATDRNRDPLPVELAEKSTNVPPAGGRMSSKKKSRGQTATDTTEES